MHNKFKSESHSGVITLQKKKIVSKQADTDKAKSQSDIVLITSRVQMLIDDLNRRAPLPEWIEKT
jgi:hypothetical protein